MFITDAQLTTFLKSVIQNAGSDLPDFWADLAVQANLQAYGDIVGSLSERGYSAAQIAAWDRGAEFQKAQAAYYALLAAKANQPEQYSLEAINRWNRLDQLRGNEREGVVAVAVLNGGVFQFPEGPQGLPSVGPVDGSGDLFGVPIDPNDPRIGEVVRF